MNWNGGRNVWRAADGWSRRLRASGVLAIGIALLSSAPAQAGWFMRECRRLCVEEIAACIDAGGKKRACRRQTLRSCKLEGFGVCATPDEALADARRAANSTLASPSSLSAVAASSTTVDLRWIESNTREIGHIVERSRDAFTGFTVIASLGKDSETYRDASAVPATTYFYRVRAVGRKGVFSPYSNVASATTPSGADASAPSMPSGVSATATTCTQVALSWNPSSDSGGSGLAGYRVYRDGIYVKLVLAPATSTNDTGLTGSRTYAYQLTAVDNAGNVSPMSSPANATTPTCVTTTTSTTTTSTTRPPTTTTTSTQPTTTSTTTTRPSTTTTSSTTTTTTRPPTTTTSTTTTRPPTTTTSTTTTRPPTTTTSTSTTTTTLPLAGGGTLRWARNFGGNAATIGYAVATDASGNIAVAGSFEGTVNFGGGSMSTAGNSDIFVAKYTPAGQHLWSRRAGATSLDAASAIAVDAGGNVIAAGHFYGTVDFGGGPLTSVGGSDGFVAKYSATGQHLWSRRVGGGSSDSAKGVAVDASGNVVLTGAFVSSADFGGGTLGGSGTTAFVAKYSSTGGHLWSRASGGGGEGRGVEVDGSGSVVLTGYVLPGTDLGGGPLAGMGMSDIFVAKYSATGAHVWSRSFGGPDFDQGNGVTVDAGGNVLVTGRFRGSLNAGGALLASRGADDLIVAKYSPAGAHLWSSRFGGTFSDSGAAIATDASGNVALTGYFEGTASFGGGDLVSTLGREIFVAKYSAAGGHLWSKRFGGWAADQGLGVAFDPAGNTAATGMFAYNFIEYGGPELTTLGLGDMFLVSIAP